MSAWLVSDAHIAVLVNTAARLGLVTNADEARTLGQVLRDENYRSLEYRYPDDADGDRPGPIPNPDRTFTLTTTERTFDLVGVDLALKSYDYQSCEHPGYQSSEAHSWVERIERAIIEKLTEQHGPDFTRVVPRRHGSGTTYAFREGRQDDPYYHECWNVESFGTVPREQVRA